MAFMFGGDTGKTYEDIQRKRRMAESMAAQMGTPRNVGEGLSAIGKALAVRGLNKQADKGEDKLRGNVNDAWAGISQALGRRQGGGTPFNPGASSPVNVPDRNSPEGIGDDTMAALGTPQFTPGDRESFTAAIMPYARQAAEQTGLDPRLIVAQAAQETGWGKSVPNGNLFGIKSHGKPGGARLSTQEYRNGQMGEEQASFRQYDDIGQSVQDYAAFLQENPRYRQMLEAGDLDSQVAALGQSGYATDPNYAQSVGSIARSIQVPGMDQMPQGRGQQPPGQPQQGGGISIDQLAMVAGSPVASDAQRMIAQTLLQRQLAQPDPMRDLQMQKAQLEIEQMRNPEPDLTGTQREYAQAREQGFEGSILDYRRALAEAGRDQQNINVGQGESAFAESTGKLMAQEAADIVSQGAQAQRSMAQINTLEDALANAPSGAGGALLNAAANLGIKTEGSSDVEVANAIISQLVPAQRPPGSGVMSDADLEMFRQSLPRLINTREGNRRIIDTMRGIADYDMQRGQIARRLQLGEITPQQASQAYQALGNPLSGFQEDMRGSGGGAPAPQSSEDDLTPEERRYLGLE